MESLEIEQRYKIIDPERTLVALAEHGVVLLGEKHVVDQWFAPTSVHSHEQEEEWFDNNHGVAYRIRTVSTGSDKPKAKVILDSKQLTEANDHNTFEEHVLMEDDKTATPTTLPQPPDPLEPPPDQPPPH